MRKSIANTLKKSHDESIVEEITQEAFFKALKSIEKFDGSKDIRAWLFTIAKNTYFSHYKKKKNQIDLDVKEESSTRVQIVKHLTNEEDAFTVHQLFNKRAHK